ncbi:MAG: DUF4832 domain-containing protein [Paludibacteraceae bacterium]|nr:DUF4832 domain-containing protein [Paludibacteraceae bacterium]
MRKITFYLLTLCTLSFVACKDRNEQEEPTPTDPKGTIYFEESDEVFANPERGFHTQIYCTLKNHLSAEGMHDARLNDFKTLYLTSYYLTDFISSDISDEFLQRIDDNMNALRLGGAKAIVRFSYKDGFEQSDKPWDATPEWVSRHIDQLTPYLQKNADVILCVQCGFIGSWGEWYYTEYFDKDMELRWQVAEHMMRAVPADRQICFRTPAYKQQYLKSRGLSVEPLTAEEAYQPTIKARWAGHNDCFVSSSNDVGTYRNLPDRDFWAEDTKYTIMGGETCEKCARSKSEYAIPEMEKYHWTYINDSYYAPVIGLWRQEKKYDEIKRRLGYRLVLDKIYFSQNAVHGCGFSAKFTVRNVGFAAPVNKRDVEFVFVNASNPADKHIFPVSDVDPRFWMAGESHNVITNFGLDDNMSGEYRVYLNLPDPYASLHTNPDFSIRLANKDMWEPATGYNYLTNITVQ